MNKYRRFHYVNNQLTPLLALLTVYTPDKRVPCRQLALVTRVHLRPNIRTLHEGITSNPQSKNINIHVQDGRSVKMQDEYSHGRLRPRLPLREYARREVAEVCCSQNANYECDLTINSNVKINAMQATLLTNTFTKTLHSLSYLRAR